MRPLVQPTSSTENSWDAMNSGLKHVAQVCGQVIYGFNGSFLKKMVIIGLSKSHSLHLMSMGDLQDPKMEVR